MGGGTRQRKRPPTQQQQQKQQQKSQQHSIDTNNINNNNNNDDDDDTNDSTTTNNNDWKSIIKSHPLTYGIVLIGIPYLLHLIWRWIVLQHPSTILLPLFLPISLQSSLQSSLQLRPVAIGMNDTRQVLILGSMSSGTSSIALALQEELQLEIGHEDSDTLWKFVRDGTVSWFHGIRYWENDNNNNNNKDETTTTTTIDSTASTSTIPDQLCKVSWYFRTNRQNYGFGPTLFGTPNYNCSFLHPKFHTCYLHACHIAMEREYACASKTTTSTSSSSSSSTTDTSSSSSTSSSRCATPFYQTLLQTREPWKIVQSLSAKYCWKQQQQTQPQPQKGSNEDSDNNQKMASPMFLSKPPKTLHWLFQALQVLDNDNQNVTTTEESSSTAVSSSSCIMEMLDYVVGYYNTILDNAPNVITSHDYWNKYHDHYNDGDSINDNNNNNNVNNNVIIPNDAIIMYKIETTSPCEVAKLAGLWNPQTTVYLPNHERIRKLCSLTNSENQDKQQQQQQQAKSLSSLSSPKPTNTINKGRVTKEDLIPYLSLKNLEKLKALYERLGYDYPEE